MEIIEAVFSAVFNIFSVYIDFRIIRLFLPKKEKPVYLAMSIYFLVWAVNWGIYYGLDNSVLTTGSLLLGTFIATVILYGGNLIQKIVAVVASIALGLILEDFVWRFLENSTFGNDAAFGSLLSCLVTIFVVLILEKFLHFEKMDVISLGSQLNIIIVLAGSVVIGEVLVKLGAASPNWTMLGTSVLCLINVSTFYLYEKINDAYVQRAEKEMAVQRVAMYKNQFSVLDQSQKNIGALQHDMKNHMLLLSTYLEKKEYDNASVYLQSVMELIDISGKHVNSGNTEVDAILNYMLDKAEKMSCRIETQIEIPNSSFMSEFDLNVLLSNLLDNALEALEKTKNKYLFVGLKYKNGLLIVRIYNTYDGMLHKDGKYLITRKQNKERHGIGLQNVDEIVEKYDGELVRETTDLQFKTNIVLYLKAVQK